MSLLKSHSTKLQASSFNNINWIGFYRLIKLRFWMGQIAAGFFDKANQRYSFFFVSFQKNCLKNEQTRNFKLFIVVQQTPWSCFFL